MNDKTSMRSEPNGELTNLELSMTPEYDNPESLLPSLIALNTWLLTFEDRPDRADQRGA
jgi:hypothetical protein